MLHNHKTKNKMMKKSILLTLALSISVAGFSQEKMTEEQLVYAAVDDYVLGLYNAEPERIARSIDTTLYKVGYYDYNGESQYHMPMTYQQLYDLSAKWNKDNYRKMANAPREIKVYEVFDKSASAFLKADWGIDFIHLYKDATGTWKIKNILWQSPPK